MLCDGGGVCGDKVGVLAWAWELAVILAELRERESGSNGGGHHEERSVMLKAREGESLRWV